MLHPILREDFLGLDQGVFFNNASHSPLLRVVKERIDAYLNEVANLSAADVETMDHLDKLRHNCARLVGAQPEEIGFAGNTSFGLNLAVTGLDFQSGDEIIMADNEFPAVVYPFRVLENSGVELRLAETGTGDFSLEQIVSMVTPSTRVLVISYVQFFNGFRQDLAAIGDFCREKDILFVVDGIHGVGTCPIDVHACHIDILACGGSKWLLALPGSGFFFLSDSAKRKIKSFQTGWFGVDWKMEFSNVRKYNLTPFADARRFNLGTYPFLYLWALEAATGYLLGVGIENIYHHNIELLDRLIDYVSSSGFFEVRSSLEPRHRSSIISIGSPAGKELADYLIAAGFRLSYREGGLRVSVNLYNTSAEIDSLIENLERFKTQRG